MAPLQVTAGLRAWQFDPAAQVLVGRGQGCDIILDDPRVSREHLRIEYDGGWVIHDLSSQGVWSGDERLARHYVSGELTVRLADPTDGPVLVLNGGRGRDVTVGRARDNDIVLNDVLVSRHHARLERVAGGWQLVDLGSRNRTLVNGQPVESTMLVTDGDRLTVGGTDIVVDGDDLVPLRAARARLVADGVGYTLPTGDSLLSGVNLDVGPGDLVAVVGPSGAGKSTLLKVLTGELRPGAGDVGYDGYDIHEQRAAVATRIGVVPQDDVLHAKLTARRALSYAAMLRLPDDTSFAERRRRVADTLAELGMSERADVRIDRLSGGQRKRVSMALELLTSPSLLVLDEPTSGLDPALDRQVMAVLRAIADAGRTVVVVTHNVTNLDQCDVVLLLAPGGIPMFTGPPAELPAWSGTTDWADIFSHVTAGTAPDPKVAQPAGRVPRAAAPPAYQGGLWRQARTLARRHLRLIFADPGYALFLALVPLVLAVLALAVPGDAGLRMPSDPPEASQILVLLFVGAAFMGGAAAAREVIGERSIFLRERAVGLRPAAYAAAKVGVFAGISAVQATLLVGAIALVKPRPEHPVLLGNATAEIAVAVWCTALASCLLGLLASALVRSTEQVMPVLVVTVMAQLVLCGGMIPVTGRVVLAQLSWLAPARWGYAAGASTVDLNNPVSRDQLWNHVAGWWSLSVGALVLFGAICVGLLTIRLARR